jgi:hypothetical protein
VSSGAVHSSSVPSDSVPTQRNTRGAGTRRRELDVRMRTTFWFRFRSRAKISKRSVRDGVGGVEAVRAAPSHARAICNTHAAALHSIHHRTPRDLRRLASRA